MGGGGYNQYVITVCWNNVGKHKFNRNVKKWWKPVISFNISLHVQKTCSFFVEDGLMCPFNPGWGWRGKTSDGLRPTSSLQINHQYRHPPVPFSKACCTWIWDLISTPVLYFTTKAFTIGTAECLPFFNKCDIHHAFSKSRQLRLSYNCRDSLLSTDAF